ncbi:MAG: neutral zinc metallopeptidase [Saprospiraceae bacterium]
MKWQGRRQSDNLEDRRGMGTTGKVVAGGGALGLIFLLVQLFFGGDSQEIAQALESQLQQQTTSSQSATPISAEEKKVGEFVSTVLADTEDVWNKLFQANGARYQEPKLVLFKDGTNSACGGASASTGPFYCPADQTVYMDMSFFQQLTQRFGAKGGDFAIAYVIAHEIGHHVQNQQGLLNKVQSLRQRLSERESNKVNVAMELQADFYAGVWAHHINKYLNDGDVEEAMNAAAAVGDDNIQKNMGGRVAPESFTHGTSEQRVYWFTRGYKSGDMRHGDTFDALLK